MNVQDVSTKKWLYAKRELLQPVFVMRKRKCWAEPLAVLSNRGARAYFLMCYIASKMLVLIEVGANFLRGVSCYFERIS